MSNQVELTEEEIIAKYNELQSKKREQQKEKEESYVTLRNQIVLESFKEVKELKDVMQHKHASIMSNMFGFREVMNDYGDLSKKSKGGFSIVDDSGTKKMTLRFRSIGEFDERAEAAEQHIRTFLSKEIEVSSASAYKLVIGLLERTKGKLEYSRVMQILKYENDFTDPDWRKGCELLKESFQTTDTKYYVEFEEKDEEGKWQRVELNFSAFNYPPKA